MLKWANYTIACNEQKGEIFKKHVRVIKNTKKKKITAIMYVKKHCTVA